LFKKIPGNQGEVKAFLKKAKVRYGDFSAGGGHEQVWCSYGGKAIRAAYCLFPREWESGILEESRWGLKWAAVPYPGDLAQETARLSELFKILGAASVAARIPMANHPFVQVLEGCGFRYAGGLVVLKMARWENRPTTASQGNAPRPVTRKDLIQLEKIAYSAFKEGRFYHEPGLKPGSARKIYSIWAKNSVHYADVVRVAGKKNILGFVSLKKDPGIKRLWIDLIAVAPGAQGGGVGGLLVTESLGHIPRQKGWTFGVKTEPENLLALRFYLKNGFELESFQLDYVWRREG
jgi:ribosomal protein S18 acetylase RimI-like enzyme